MIKHSEKKFRLFQVVKKSILGICDEKLQKTKNVIPRFSFVIWIASRENYGSSIFSHFLA